MKSATLQLNKFQQAQNRHIVTIEHHYNTLLRDWGWKRQMSSRGIRTRDLAIHDDRRFWPRFSGILGALVKWLSSRTYAQVPLLEEVSFFMVWFDPDLPVLHIHLNNTGPTARLTARCYRARLVALHCTINYCNEGRLCGDLYILSPLKFCLALRHLSRPS